MLYNYRSTKTDSTDSCLGLMQVKDTRDVVRGTYWPRDPVGDTTHNIVTAFLRAS